ncbi:MAG TPA: YraN family protein [Gammaproteobacteria bacterium]|nr:YraN family protein [Gammaproteobacteria bacterium]
MFSFKRQVGNQAETIALKYLCKHNLELIEQNYLTQAGEIDIIMLDKSEQTLVFIEVRYRQNTQFGSATESVDRHKQAKLIRTAQYYLQRHSKYQEFICRFDVVGVESYLKYPTINWIKNAFEA